MGASRASGLDFVFTSLGLPLFLFDVVSDVFAALSFYQDGAWFSLAVLLLLLLGSSILVQAYSWLWYSYDNFRRDTAVEKCVGPTALKLLHFFQLGIYYRQLAVLETSVKAFCCVGGASEDAVYLTHDLSMLRIVETFSEGAPQIILTMAIALWEGDLRPIIVIKMVASASAVAYCVTMYHRSLRSFLPDKQTQSVKSSAVFFLWNLLLVSSRLAAIGLFSSVLPCKVFAHFLCCWSLLFFFAWRAKTNFMDSSGGEWLYRATVGLVWYFHWFNVVEGRTRYWTLLYHIFILLDILALCGVWVWKMATDPPSFAVPPLAAGLAALGVVLVYILGLGLKLLYYKCFHPNLKKEDLKGNGSGDETDAATFRSFQAPPPPKAYNHRMRKLAVSFYS